VARRAVQRGQNQPVADAELSSLSTTLDDVRRRIGALAETHQKAGHDDVAIDLFEIERSIVTAVRRLTKLVDDR